MLRNALAFSLLLAVTGCGGGGSDSSSTPGTGTGGNSGNGSDPLAQFINVQSQYTGLKTAAALDKTGASRFMQTITTLHPELLPTYDDEAGSSERLCINGGSATLTPNKANTEIAITFNQCNEGGNIFTGNATLRVVSTNASGDITEAITVYQDTQLRTDNNIFIIRGTSRQRELTGSCDSTLNLNNLLLTVQGSSEQWYFENLYDQRFGSYGIYCENGGMALQGRVYISDIGYVNVTTPTLLKLPTMIVTQPQQGHLALAGADGHVFNWQIKNDGSPYNALFTYHFTLNGPNEFHYVYRATTLNNQLLTNFRDSDGDGMPDAWESYFGLNPADPNDAIQDADGDGYTNLEEFRYLGNPQNADIMPFIYKIDVKLQHEPGRQTALIYAETLLTHQQGAAAYNSELVYYTAEPMRFSESNHDCVLSDNRLQARCAIRDINAGQIASHIIVLDAPSSQLTAITAPLSVELVTTGLNTSNQQTATTELSRAAAILDFTLYSAAQESAPIIAVLNEPTSTTLRLALSSASDRISGITLKLELPDFANAEAQCKQFDDWQPCDNFNIRYPDYNTEIALNVTATATGIGQATFQLFAPDNTEVLANWSFPIIAGQDTAVLQQQIDAAAAGAIMNVPAGIYIGSLHLTDKNITLRGTTKQTYLLGKALPNSYEQRMLLIDHNSEISDFTLSSLQIETGENGAILTSNRMGATELLLPGNEINANGSITLQKNQFITNYYDTPFANFFNGSYCTGVRLLKNDFTAPRDFIYTNNLMLKDNNIPNYCHPIYLAGGYISKIEHNTIMGIYEFLELRAYDGASHIELLMRNNVFSQVNTALSLQFTLEQFTMPPLLKIDIINNLYDETRYPVYGAALPYTMADNLFTAAGLNSFGIPMAGSAVIDAAATSTITDDFFGNSRPTDGDGNGEASPDIGAIEKQP
ncbi:hypothetical protein GCM10010919_04940 [Alishewanella longhuensis]|uniref:Uncharacterized protein n=1 Tax=Alishewanella longhuensis TaxID=1091037 RepID=A0ABQ3KUE8_9ALTE|nr:hypothetical protein [Alishewanella longhuensis]GHG60959.1 hypothetical protein GCM10010919_04940 [Alishewanella longhuensis]